MTDWTKQTEEMFKAWSDAQKKLMENWAESMKGPDIDAVGVDIRQVQQAQELHEARQRRPLLMRFQIGLQDSHQTRREDLRTAGIRPEHRGGYPFEIGKAADEHRSGYLEKDETRMHVVGFQLEWRALVDHAEGTGIQLAIAPILPGADISFELQHQ